MQLLTPVLKSRKFALSIVLGILSAFLSRCSIGTQLNEINIHITIAPFLPILVSMAWGWRYGLLAGLTGGIYFPFILWPNNGWSNPFSALIYLGAYVLIGFLYHKKKGKYSWLMAAVVLFAAVYFFYYGLLFNKMLSLNPPFWESDTISKLPREQFLYLALKGSITVLFSTISAEIVLRINTVRRLLNIPVLSIFKHNLKILLSTILIVLLMGITFFTLIIIFKRNNFNFQDPHIQIELLIIVLNGIIVSRIAFHYNERKNSIIEKHKISEEKYRTFFENLYDVFFSTSIEGTILEISPSIEHHTGLKRKEILGKNASDFYSNSKARTSFLNKLLKQGYIYDHEITLKSNEDEKAHCSINAKLIYDKENNPVKIEGLLRNVSQRKLSEEKAEEYKIRLRAITQQITSGITLVNMDGKYIFVNPAFSKMAGYSEQELLQMSILDFLPHQDLKETIFQKVKDKKVYSSRGKIKSKDNKTIDVEISGKEIEINGEKFILGIIRDISENIKKEKEIIRAKEKAEENERKLKNSQEIAKLGGWELDIETRTFTFTDSFYKIFHTTAEEMGGYQMTIQEYSDKFVHPDDALMVAEETSRAITTNDPYFTRYIEHRVLYTDGGTGYIGIRFFIKKDKNGKTIKTFGVNQDITEKKNSEIELLNAKNKAEENENRLKEAQALAHIGHWEFNLKNNKPTWSDETYRIFNYIPQEFEPTYDTFLNHIHPDDRAEFNNAYTKHLKTKKDYEISYRILLSNGEIKYVFGQCRSEFDKTGNPLRSVGTVADITKQKLNEIELLKAKEKAEETDRFLANMSHEIRTPMNGILGFASLLKEPGLSGENQQEYVRLIEKSGTRMLNIIEEIINISKIESGQMAVNLQETNINTLSKYVYDTLKIEAEKKGLKFTIKNGLPDEEAKVTSDTDKFYSILTNLIKNAIKYTDEGFVEFGYVQENNYLKFFVRDSGIGIPENRQGAIFERFIQADITDIQARQGAGLGLSIAKAFTEMLGGEISLESKAGKGSTFYFTIPYQAKPQLTNARDNKKEEKESKIKSLKTLIVEDDTASQLYLSTILKCSSKEIIIAGNGSDAIKACKNNNDIDLILMDIKMPKMDGYETTQKIREFNKEVVIIAQTAFALSGDHEKAIEAGCNDYISKPINRTELLKLIEKHF